MNKEKEAKLNWNFEALRFILENNSTFDEDHKKKLLDDADRIELDFELKETSLENKTEDALGRKNA